MELFGDSAPRGDAWAALEIAAIMGLLADAGAVLGTAGNRLPSRDCLAMLRDVGMPGLLWQSVAIMRLLADAGAILRTAGNRLPSWDCLGIYPQRSLPGLAWRFVSQRSLAGTHAGAEGTPTEVIRAFPAK